MNISKGLIIAVDFDGTIVEDSYPGIGHERLFAFETLKRLQADGHRLILWTYRQGKKLEEETVAYCKANGLDFYAVNKSSPEEVSRKIHTDLFIDDRNIGGILGWGEIYQMLTNEAPQHPKDKKKKGFFRF